MFTVDSKNIFLKWSQSKIKLKYCRFFVDSDFSHFSQLFNFETFSRWSLASVEFQWLLIFLLLTITQRFKRWLPIDTFTMVLLMTKILSPNIWIEYLLTVTDQSFSVCAFGSGNVRHCGFTIFSKGGLNDFI